MSKIIEDGKNIANYISLMRNEGKRMIHFSEIGVPPTSGLFEADAPMWEPGKTYTRGDIFRFGNSVGYVKQPTLVAQDNYPPFSVGTEALYGARPIPDTVGVYPYTYNMGIFEGMLVKDNGIVYKSITGTWDNPTELLYNPSQVPSMLIPIEDDTNEPSDKINTEWSE